MAGPWRWRACSRFWTSWGAGVYSNLVALEGGRPAPEAPAAGLDEAGGAMRASPASVSASPVVQLDGFLHLIGFEALRADVSAHRTPLEQDAYLLHVHVPAPWSGAHGVAAVVAKTRCLPAHRTDSGHLLFTSLHRGTRLLERTSMPYRRSRRKRHGKGGVQ